MLTATCHCAAVRLQVPRRPERLTDCNCSLCRRYAARWAYYLDSEVSLHAAPGATHEYSWGPRELRFIRCAQCGCIMQWRGVEIAADSWEFLD